MGCASCIAESKIDVMINQNGGTVSVNEESSPSTGTISADEESSLCRGTISADEESSPSTNESISPPQIITTVKKSTSDPRASTQSSFRAFLIEDPGFIDVVSSPTPVHSTKVVSWRSEEEDEGGELDLPPKKDYDDDGFDDIIVDLDDYDVPVHLNHHSRKKVGKVRVIRVSENFNCENGLKDLNRDILIRLIGSLEKGKIKKIVGMSQEHYNWTKTRFFKLLRYNFVRNFPLNQICKSYSLKGCEKVLFDYDGGREIIVDVDEESVRKKEKNIIFFTVFREDFSRYDWAVFRMAKKAIEKAHGSRRFRAFCPLA